MRCVSSNLAKSEILANEPEEYWSKKKYPECREAENREPHGKKGALTRGRNAEGVVHSVEMRLQIVAMPMFEEEMVLE